MFSGSFINRTSAWWNRDWLVPTVSDAGVLLAKNGFVADLRYGAVISGGKVFGEGHSSGLLFTYGPYGGGTINHHRGNLALEKTDYVGFKFAIAGKVHFRWIRMKISVHPFQGQEKMTVDYLRDCAYETVPGKPIIAGKTRGADVIVRDGTLGELAAGRK